MRFRYQVVTLTTNTLTIEEQICPDPGDLWDDTKNLVTITKWHNDGADEGRLESIENPDGTMTLYSYDDSPTAGALEITEETGEPNGAKTAIVNGHHTL